MSDVSESNPAIKVVAINASTHGTSGNTNIALENMKENLQAEGIETEIITLAEKQLNPCKGCAGCKGTNACVQDDDINEIYQQLITADGIILASPTYFSKCNFPDGNVYRTHRIYGWK